jgi:uncharacterized protein YbjT (DUF2867 family)
VTTVILFGGTGFLGRRLAQRLAAEGTSLRLTVRRSRLDGIDSSPTGDCRAHRPGAMRR